MVSLLLVIIYAAFISLGLPDSLLGSAWPVMHADIGAPVSRQLYNEVNRRFIEYYTGDDSCDNKTI